MPRVNSLFFNTPIGKGEQVWNCIPGASIPYISGTKNLIVILGKLPE